MMRRAMSGPSGSGRGARERGSYQEGKRGGVRPLSLVQTADDDVAVVDAGDRGAILD